MTYADGYRDGLEAAAELLQQRGSKLRRMGATDDFDLLRDMAWQVRALSSRISASAPSPLEEIGEAAVIAAMADAVYRDNRSAVNGKVSVDADWKLEALIDAEIARRALEGKP